MQPAQSTDAGRPTSAYWVRFFASIVKSGFSFAKEYDIERKWRESRLYQIAPISTNMVLAYVGQHVLGMERSY